MSSSRLSGYRQPAGDPDEHPGTDNYPADSLGDYQRYGAGQERPSYHPKYTPEYKKAAYPTGAGAGVVEDYDSYEAGSPPGGYETGLDDDDWDDWDEPDRRWKWVAAAAGAVLLVAVLITVLVVSGGDDTNTAATTETSAAPRTVIATAPSATTPVVPAPAPSPTAELPPETVTTVTPAPPVEESPAPAPVEEGAAPPAPAPGTITYTVTGSRQLFDLVSIVYTDEQGLPRTDVNVALPWTRTLVLSPGVTTMSVIATSVSGQLNCSITDAAGAVVVAQENNMMISTCAK